MLRKAGAAPVDQGNLKLPNPLFKAVELDQLNKVQLLVEKGADVNGRSDFGVPVFTYALGCVGTKGHPNGLSIVKFLISKGADLNEQPKLGSPPLLQAAQANNAELVALLLEKGAKPDVAIGPPKYTTRRTALLTAVERGNIEMVRLLIKAGADLNLRDEQSRTALTIAVQMKQENIASVLRAAGAKE